MNDIYLEKKIIRRIDLLISRYPSKRSATIPILYLVQKKHGFVSQHLTEWISKKLQLSHISIYELLTFYPMLRSKPVSKKYIKICRSLSCALNGSYSIYSKLQNKFNYNSGDIPVNYKYTISFVECLANCDQAPVVQVNELLYEKVRINQINNFIAEVNKEERVNFPYKT